VESLNTHGTGELFTSIMGAKVGRCFFTLLLFPILFTFLSIIFFVLNLPTRRTAIASLFDRNDTGVQIDRNDTEVLIHPFEALDIQPLNIKKSSSNIPVCRTDIPFNFLLFRIPARFSYLRHFENQSLINRTDPDFNPKLLANFVDSISIHRENNECISILIFDDDDCLNKIQKVKPELVPFFKNEQEGSYRGDICRGAILFETGGLYLDIDIRPLVSMLELFSNSSSDFASVEMDDKLSFFNAIIYVPKASKLMIIYLEKLLFLYEHQNTIGTIFKWPNVKNKRARFHLGPYALHLAYEQIQTTNENLSNPIVLQEINLASQMNLREYQGKVALQVGKGCCCNYLSVDPIGKTIFAFSRFVGFGKSYCD